MYNKTKGMKKIIEQAPQHFDFFKQNLLTGLITRYCKEIIRSEESKEKLNKVVVIYAEHIRHLDTFKNIDVIIDQEFINELKKYLKLILKNAGLRFID